MSRMVYPTKSVFIPVADFGGVNGTTWQPRNGTEAIRVLYYDPMICAGQAINVRCLWSTSDTTTTNSATWKAVYKAVTIDSTDTLAAPSTALDTAIVADTVIGTANALQMTAAGVINADNLTDGDALLLEISCSATTGLTLNPAASGNSRVTLMGVVLEYVVTNL